MYVYLEVIPWVIPCPHTFLTASVSFVNVVYVGLWRGRHYHVHSDLVGDIGKFVTSVCRSYMLPRAEAATGGQLIVSRVVPVRSFSFMCVPLCKCMKGWGDPLYRMKGFRAFHVFTLVENSEENSHNLLKMKLANHL
jgi:hypothetical protein